MFFDIFLDRFRLRRACPAFHGLAFGGNQKFLKVPFDHLQSHNTGFLLLEPFEQWRSIVTVDVDFVKDRECDPVILFAERHDFIVRAWVLRIELVTRESQDNELVRVCV